MPDEPTNEEIFDLDALKPPPRKMKLDGKIILCYPLTMEQLISVAGLEARLVKINSVDEMRPIVAEALGPVMPDLKDPGLTLTAYQLKQLIQFAIKISTNLGDEPKEIKQYTDPKKKDNLAAGSPSS